METLQAIAEVVGALSVLFGALSHVPFIPEKARSVLAHLGVNLAGAIGAVKK